MNQNIRIKILVATGVILVAAIICAVIFSNLLKSVSSVDNAQNIEFKINQGAGAGAIIKDLYDDGLIKSKIAFEIYAFLRGELFMFKPGIYELNKGQAAKEIIDILVGGQKAISATITPGMTLRETDDYFSGLKIINSGTLINFDINKVEGKYPYLSNAKSLEGFLFPDTYMFFLSSEPIDVVDKILDNFQKKAAALTDISNLNDLSKKLILASLLEKEVIDYKDRQIVAGILEKRISAGMPLQIDATVVYAKCGGRFQNDIDKCEINRSDFKIDSPYNTYKYKGYPPAPISNPDIDSINAALDPIKTNYWYYLSDPETKKTIFAKTLEEQNANQAKYLR